MVVDRCEKGRVGAFGGGEKEVDGVEDYRRILKVVLAGVHQAIKAVGDGRIGLPVGHLFKTRPVVRQ